MEHPTIDALVAGLRASRERFRLTTEQDLRQLQVELAGLSSTAKVVPTPFVETPTRPRTAGGVGISPRTVEPLRERLRELKARMNAEDAGGAQLMATLRDEPREALACRVVVAERRSDELRAELEVVGHALTRETQRCTAVEQRLRQETANPNPNPHPNPGPNPNPDPGTNPYPGPGAPGWRPPSAPRRRRPSRPSRESWLPPPRGSAPPSARHATWRPRSPS